MMRITAINLMTKASTSRWAKLACIATLWYLLAMLSWQPVAAQNANDECLQMVRRLYSKLNTSPEPGKIYQIRYTTHARARRNGKPVDYTQSVRIVMSVRRMHMQSKDMEVYHDGNYAYTVIPANKRIYLTDSDLEGARESRMNMLATFQDSLFSMCSVVRCSDTHEGGDGGKSVLLQLDARGRARYGINTLTVFIDPKQQTIRKLSVAYVAGRQLESVEITVDGVDRDYKTNEFNAPVHSMFLDAQQQLLPKYRGYTLVDNRKNRRNR
jgi:hypothetical protein